MTLVRLWTTLLNVPESLEIMQAIGMVLVAASLTGVGLIIAESPFAGLFCFAALWSEWSAMVYAGRSLRYSLPHTRYYRERPIIRDLYATFTEPPRKDKPEKAVRHANP